MRRLKPLAPIIFTLLVIFVFYVKRFAMLKFYPPICNLFIFCLFFFSLFGKETIIQKFARACGDKLEKSAFEYTRKVTYLWCIFTFFNFIISVWTIFLPDNIWIIYNGFVSYILIGIVFGVEYLVRISLRKRNLI